jgi:hypothetical protein
VLSSNGAILVIGQVFFESTGAVSSQNGEVILENLSSDGNSGSWFPISAPVQVPNVYDNFCPNYSSALLPATDGSSILELTSAYNSSGTCGGYYASETWNNLPADGSMYAFINLHRMAFASTATVGEQRITQRPISGPAPARSSRNGRSIASEAVGSAFPTATPVCAWITPAEVRLQAT